MAKTYTTVVDKAGGDTFSEAMWDTYLKDNINNLIVPPACRVRHNADQTLTTSVGLYVLYNTEDFDTDGMHSTSVNTERITIDTIGIYSVTFNFYYGSSTAGIRDTLIHYNGTTTIARNYDASQTAGYLIGSISTIYAAASAGVYFRSYAWQNSGGNVTFGSSNPEVNFSAIWLGRTS